VKPLGALRIWTVAALLGGASVLTYLQVVYLGFVPPLAIFVLLALIVAGSIASGWRWAPLLGAVWSGLVIAANAPYMAYDLTHPDLFDHFAIALTVLALTTVGIMAGMGATVQSERARKKSDSETKLLRAPRWFATALGTLAGLGLGAILVAAIPSDTAAAGVSAETLAQLPALAAMPNRFDRAQLRARVGETVALRIENRDEAAHRFEIDELHVHVSLPAGTSSLALFRPSTPGSYTFYCSIPGHREAGMVGTLIVVP